MLAGARIGGLIVARKHHEGFLGYERTSVTAPAPLAWWFKRHQRDSFLIVWADIESITGDLVRLRPGFTRWSSAL